MKPVFYIVNQVWGKDYIDLFLKYSLPSFLSDGNFGMNDADFIYILYCDEKDHEILEESPSFKRLRQLCQVELRDRVQTIIDDKYEEMNLYHSEVAEQGAEKNIPVIYLNPDVIYSDGAITRVVELWKQGYKCVQIAGVITAVETAAAELDGYLNNAGDILTINTLDLTALMFRNRHEFTKMSDLNESGSVTHYSNIFISNGYVMLNFSLHRHPLMVHTHKNLKEMQGTLDLNFVHENIRTEFIYNVLNSDEIMQIELSKRGKLKKFIHPSKPLNIGKKYFRFCMSQNIQQIHFAQTPIIYKIVSDDSIYQENLKHTHKNSLKKLLFYLKRAEFYKKHPVFHAFMNARYRLFKRAYKYGSSFSHTMKSSIYMITERAITQLLRKLYSLLPRPSIFLIPIIFNIFHKIFKIFAKEKAGKFSKYVCILQVNALQQTGYREEAYQLMKDNPHFPLLKKSLVTFLAGRYKEMSHLYQRLNANRQEKKQYDVCLLGNSFSTALGHYAYIDIIIKAYKLGCLPAKKIYFEVRDKHELDGYFAKFFIDYVTPVLKGDVSTLKERYGDDLLDISITSMPYDNNIMIFYEYCARIEQERQTQKQNFPLYLKHYNIEVEKDILYKKYNIAKDRKIVLLHVRDDGFHADWNKVNPATRNADTDTYQEAVNYLVDHGYTVIRMGDDGMKKLNWSSDHIIDYAHIQDKNIHTDMMFCLICDFFIGTNSGLSFMPGLFERPCALTNWTPLFIPNHNPHDIFIPKLVWHNKKRRYLTFSEMLSGISACAQFTTDFKGLDLQFHDNSPQDITLIVKEMLAKLNKKDGCHDEPDDDKKLLDKFDDIVYYNGGYKGGNISVEFLKKYNDLLA